MRGSCLCGAVTYTVDGPLRPVIACHCVQCRKATGHYVAATSAHRDHIEVKGDVTWFKSSDTAQRGFCGACGSNLFWDGVGDNLSIMAGTVDGDTDLSIKGHIYCDFKGDYYEIADGKPQSPGYDPDMTTMVRE